MANNPMHLRYRDGSGRVEIIPSPDAFDIDHPTPTGTIQVTPTGTFAIDEGDSTGGTLSVSLSATTAPTANVTVALTKTNADVTLSRTSLTFTSSNYSNAQTVTVTAAEDSDTNHETGTITFTASGGITAPSVTKSVNIYDDEGPGYDIVPASLTLAEGEQATFQVRLETQPSMDILSSIIVRKAGNATDDLTVDTDPDTAGNQITLTFNRTDQTKLWSDYQTVTVLAEQDSDMNDDSFNVILVSNDGEYSFSRTPAVVGGLYTTVTDDDKPKPSGTIQVTPTGTLTIAEGGTGTLMVNLSAEPNADVTVTLSKTNDDVTLSGSTLSSSALTFTRANYSTAQSVTVTAAEDNADYADDTDTITFTATGGITAPNVTKAVAIADNDAPAGTIDVSPAGTLDIDEGGSGAFTVKIGGGPPNANVRVSLTSSDTDVTLSPASLTFTAGNYQNTQPVTATAAEDGDTDYETVTITLAATGGISASNATKTVKVSDNDKPAGTIVISPTGTLNIDEGDSTGGTFTVELSEKPNADVTVAIAKTNADVTLSTASLTFTESNFSDTQTVTVTAAEDGDADDDSDTITLSATGGIDASNVTKAISIDDDEPTPGAIQVSPAGTLRIDEGSSGELKVKLSAAPESSVTVTLSKTNDDITLSGADLSGSALTFTTSNYGTEQTVTVSAAEDGDTNNDSDTITFSASGGITAPDVAKRIFITDDDAPPLPTGTIQITPTGTLNIDEGDSAGGTFVVSLSVSSAPTTNVTVSLAKTNADVTLSPTSLVFTSSNHSTAQMVAVIAAEDDDASDDADTIVFTASGGIDAPQATKRIVIADNDSPPPPPGPGPSGPRGAIQITPSGTLKINEGDSREISVSLSAAPVGKASVFFSKDNTDITLSSTSLTFDASNYEVAQPLTITAAQDDDAEDDYDTIVARATGGIVAPDARQLVHVADDDFPPGTILIEPSGTLNIREGDSRAFTLRLSHRPKDDVVVTLSIPDDAPIELDAQSFTFTTLDWGDERTAIVSAVHDANAASESLTITLSASGGIDAPETEVLVEVEDDEPLPPVRSRALAFPPADAQDSATLRVRCKQDAPCTVLLDCHAQADGSAFNGALPAPIPAWGAVTLTAEDIEGHTGASWAGKGRLGCALRSQGNLSAQVWTRSSDGVLVNNSAFIRSEPEGESHRADIESIPEPDSAEKSNLRIRCEALLSDACTATRLSCYDDAGNRYDGALGSIEPRQVRHLQAAGLADIIGHRWRGMGLSCEMRSNAPFTVQVLTRTGSGGALVNNSASGAR